MRIWIKDLDKNEIFAACSFPKWMGVTGFMQTFLSSHPELKNYKVLYKNPSFVERKEDENVA